MDKKNIKIFVDGPNCISCGACVAISENKIFGFDKNAKSYAIKQPENDKEIKIAYEAAEACPVAVIHVQEEKIQNVAANDNNNTQQVAA